MAEASLVDLIVESSRIDALFFGYYSPVHKKYVSYEKNRINLLRPHINEG